MQEARDIPLKGLLVEIWFFVKWPIAIAVIIVSVISLSSYQKGMIQGCTWMVLGGSSLMFFALGVFGLRGAMEWGIVGCLIATLILISFVSFTTSHDEYLVVTYKSSDVSIIEGPSIIFYLPYIGRIERIGWTKIERAKKDLQAALQT